MLDSRLARSRRRPATLIWVLILSMGGLALQGCAALIGSAIERGIEQTVVPMVTGVVADIEKLSKASVAFYDAKSRWPREYAELEQFSHEQALDLTLAWIKDIDLVPQDDGGLGVVFNYIAVPSKSPDAKPTLMPFQIHTASGRPLIVIRRTPKP